MPSFNPFFPPSVIRNRPLGDCIFLFLPASRFKILRRYVYPGPFAAGFVIAAITGIG